MWQPGDPKPERTDYQPTEFAEFARDTKAYTDWVAEETGRAKVAAIVSAPAVIAPTPVPAPAGITQVHGTTGEDLPGVTYTPEPDPGFDVGAFLGQAEQPDDEDQEGQNAGVEAAAHELTEDQYEQLVADTVPEPENPAPEKPKRIRTAKPKAEAGSDPADDMDALVAAFGQPEPVKDAVELWREEQRASLNHQLRQIATGLRNITTPGTEQFTVTALKTATRLRDQAIKVIDAVPAEHVAEILEGA